MVDGATVGARLSVTHVVGGTIALRELPRFCSCSRISDRHGWPTRSAVGTVPAVDHEVAVQICHSDLHEHVSAVERPSHLLSLDHPLADAWSLTGRNLWRSGQTRRKRGYFSAAWFTTALCRPS